MFKITNFSPRKSSSIPHFSSIKLLATLSLPFLLSHSTITSAHPTIKKSGNSNLELGVSPSEIAHDRVINHLDKNDYSEIADSDEFSTGFEDLDYWALELELAQEMVRLNKQKKFIEDQNELRKKMINSEVKTGSEMARSSRGININSQKLNTWQATEGVVDALIRSGIQEKKSKTVKRAASKSVEQRMLSAKYNRRGGAQNFEAPDSSKPRRRMSGWMRLVYEMKNRKHHRSNGSKYRRQVR